jgi:hypothetical protein
LDPRSHVGIAGNETGHKLAKQATDLPHPVNDMRMTPADCISLTKSLELEKWQNLYDESTVGSQYKAIEPRVSHTLKMQLQNRHSDVVISRLRLGRCLNNSTLHKYNVRSDELCDLRQVREDICHLLTCPENNFLHNIKLRNIYTILADVNASQTLAKNSIASK